MKKRILIISGVFPPEQLTSAQMNYDLARELSKKYDVTVLRPYPTRPLGMVFEYQGLKDEPFKTILIESFTYPQSKLIGRFREGVDFGRKSAQYIKKHHKTISFIYNNAWHLIGVNFVARAAQKYHIPYMIAIQDVYPESLFTTKKYSSFVESLARFILDPVDRYNQKHAGSIRTISDEMADYLSSTRRIARERYIVVNNWQNEEAYRNVLNNYSSEKLIFAFVGSINLHSNVELIIKAFSEANIPNSELLLYGGGNRKDHCAEIVKKMGLMNVRFNIVKSSQIPQVQSEASILVLALPSGNGTLCVPSKITSYMLSGRPILASVDLDCATARYIKEAHCGLVVEPDNISSLKEGFKKIASLPSERLQKYGNNGKMYANLHLTREYNLRLVCANIDQLIDNKDIKQNI